MSDPPTPKQLTEAEWEILQGRVGALELLAAQSFFGLLKLVKDEDREFIIEEALIQLEVRFEKFHPIAARAALESAEWITKTALDTVRYQGKDTLSA